MFIIPESICQNKLDTVFLERAQDEPDWYKHTIKVLSEDGNTVVFPFRFTPYPLYDAYIDSNYVVLILANEDYYEIQTAYKNTLEKNWRIDLRMIIGKKMSTGISSKEIYSFRIIDGLTLEMDYNIEGSRSFMQKRLGEFAFPRKSKCLLTQRGLYNIETKSIIQRSFEPDCNSPRPKIE